MNEEIVKLFENINQVSIAAVDLIVDLAKSEVRNKGFCTIVLAGGRTPEPTYKLLGEPPAAGQMPWQQTHFFWGDERWVASTHPDSNFAMTNKTFLSKMPIPSRNIHRIPTGHKEPATGAAIYEKHLRSFFHSKDLAEANSISADSFFPSFDLVILGMGDDGHTASLFPGSHLLEEKEKWVADVASGIGSPPVARITLTLPLINQAQTVLFLLSGKKKREIMQTILEKPEDAGLRYPAARIRPAGRLIWFAAEKN